MMYYMMVSLMNNDDIRKMPYSDNILALLPIGLWVARIFIVVFLFYINSFLMKQRLKEIGLYNILGMEKRHIAVMMFFENVFVFITVFVSGMILGMVFSKLMFLILMKMIAVSSVPKFQMEMTSVFMTGGYFLAIYFVTFLYNLCKIHLSNPVELLHGTEAGEKEPKTKILMTLIGLCCIGFGYYFALTTKSPMAAMNTFFIAVILVVIGTYALFTAGSIALLKLMRKNKHFYYRTGHFFSISGMIYRMKQNAAGLASICILSTMVLVMVSSTVCLYASIEGNLAKGYPQQFSVEMASGSSLEDKDREEKLKETVGQTINENKIKLKETKEYHILSTACVKTDEGIKFEHENIKSLDSLKMLYILTVADYNRLTGENLSLEKNELYVYLPDEAYEKDTFQVEGCGNWKNKGTPDNQFICGDDVETLNSGVYLIVPDEAVMDQFEAAQRAVYGENASSEKLCYAFDTDLSEEGQVSLVSELQNNISTLQLQDEQFPMVNVNARAVSKSDYYALYGGLFFLGILLGSVFIFGMILIIYYKQITEGYEDQGRFSILMKVGMTRKEVRQSINSQVMTVFFLPLAMAGMHTAFSFPIIRKILKMFAMNDEKLLILVMICCYLAFAVFYAAVYLLTSREYYKIVSRDEKK